MINIDYRIDEPIYEQICKGIGKMIQCGVLKPNDKIPSVRELASSLSINPNTVQKAIMLMEARGFVYSVKGKGSFVTDNIDSLKETELIKITNDIKGLVQKIKAMNYSDEIIKGIVENVLKEEGVI